MYERYFVGVCASSRGRQSFKMQSKTDGSNEEEIADYDKEMGEALSTIFGNLRGLQQMRLRITPTKDDQDVGNQMVEKESGRPEDGIKFQQNISEHKEQKQQRNSGTLPVKCKRKLPVLPQQRKPIR